MTDGTFHTAVGGILLVGMVVVLAASGGQAVGGALVLGVVGVAILVYGLRRMVKSRSGDRE